MTTARGEIEARVLVTRRIPPLRLKRRTVHQIGLPYHWGSKGLSRGDAVNELVSFVADPNVSIQESKALTGNIEPGRRSRDRRVVTSGMLTEAPDPNQPPRDRPAAARNPVGRHGMRTSEEKEGEQS